MWEIDINRLNDNDYVSELYEHWLYAISENIVTGRMTKKTGDAFLKLCDAIVEIYEAQTGKEFEL